MEFVTVQLTRKADYIAPDGSEIRKLPDMRYGGLAHCALPPKSTTRAMTHKTVDEIWYFINGQGEVWRRLGKEEKVVSVYHGICLTIPVGTHFQFRNVGTRPLEIIIATMPPWPGPQEAVRVPDYWQAK